jgi:nitroreductase
MKTRATAPARSVRLPRPAFGKARALGRMLQSRQTVREFSDRELAPQTLSDLLWAAFGINRRRGPFGGCGRTAASASNSQEIDLYVATAAGTYLYDPGAHRLQEVAPRDLRALAISAGQSPVDRGVLAPVRLIYVADIDRLVHTTGFQEPGLHDPDVQRAYYYVDTGLIAANVYLFAAAAGLGAWFHNCDRNALASTLPLRKTQRVLFAQTVGYPAERSRSNRRQR